MHAQIITVDDNQVVKPYSTQPKETIIHYQKPTEFSAWPKVLAIIDEVIELLQTVAIPAVPDSSDDRMKPKSKRDRIKNILSDIKLNFQELGIMNFVVVVVSKILYSIYCHDILLFFIFRLVCWFENSSFSSHSTRIFEKVSHLCGSYFNFK